MTILNARTEGCLSRDSWSTIIPVAVVGFRYDDTDPYRVGIGYSVSADDPLPYQWSWERTSLKVACIAIGPVFGHGRVRATRVSNTLILRLDNGGPDPEFLAVAVPVVVNFLLNTEQLVPPGSETVDVDSWVRELLS